MAPMYKAVSASESGKTDDKEDAKDVRGQQGTGQGLDKRYGLLWLVLLSTVISICIFSWRPHNDTGCQMADKKQITMDHIFNGTFQSHSRSLTWLPDAGDGLYAETIDGNIVLVDLNLNSTKTLLESGGAQDVNGRAIRWDDWKLSPSKQFILLKTDSRKQWRYSTFANYYIHSLGDKTTRPLSQPTVPAQISYADWSSTGEAIAYVSQNDIYVLPDLSPNTQPIRVTSDGGYEILNGVPSWVYEEEVFEAGHTLWWSPDSKKIAYLRFDQTAVKTYSFPIYNPTEDANEYVPYPDFVNIKYPKPGFPNPIVTAHLVDLSAYASASSESSITTYELKWPTNLSPTDRVIQEVVWVANSSLLMKEVNRSADEGAVVLYEIGSNETLPTGKAVRILGKDGEHSDGGWIDFEQRIVPLPPVDGYPSGAYIDIVPSAEGYNHLALFASADVKEPYWLTAGKWEVAGTALAVDGVKGLVYYRAAAPTDRQRNLYAARLPAASLLASAASPSSLAVVPPLLLTEENAGRPTYYSAAFSPRGEYYVLSYEGPDVPWQELRKTSDKNYKVVLEDNAQLKATSAEYAIPIMTHATVNVDGWDLNVKELRPPNMDDSGHTQSPILFHMYNGPGFQLVDYKFQCDWHHYLVTTLNYVVVLVDGRGTGFKGRKMRNWVRGKVGYWESHDQVEVARQWIQRPYVDKTRVGVWGKSYGGYLTTKIMERGAGVHTLGMSLAPVTDWRMYDSVATERFMMTLERNVEGYINSSVQDVKPFGKVDFLLVHGSGDDNVHLAHSAHLLDKFTAQGIRGCRFRMFTDSDHRLVTRGAARELSEEMTAFLIEKWGPATR